MCLILQRKLPSDFFPLCKDCIHYEMAIFLSEFVTQNI